MSADDHARLWPCLKLYRINCYLRLFYDFSNSEWQQDVKIHFTLPLTHRQRSWGWEKFCRHLTTRQSEAPPCFRSLIAQASRGDWWFARNHPSRKPAYHTAVLTAYSYYEALYMSNLNHFHYKSNKLIFSSPPLQNRTVLFLKNFARIF